MHTLCHVACQVTLPCMSYRLQLQTAKLHCAVNHFEQSFTKLVPGGPVEKSLRTTELRDSSPKKYSINYSPSCHSKPIGQIQIFLIQSENFLTLRRQEGSYHIQGPEIIIIEIIHVFGEYHNACACFPARKQCLRMVLLT